MKLLIFILIFIALFNISFAEEYMPISNNKMLVKYMFWSPPKYSFDNITWVSANPSFSFGSYKQSFKSQFNPLSENYKLMKRSEKKLIAGNLFFAVPGGICLGIAISDITVLKKQNNYDYILLASGILLAVGDILLGRSSYKDLNNAVTLRNDNLTE